MIQPDEIIRSRRKTLSVTITPSGRVVVRAPARCGEERIFAFLREKENRIARYLRQAEETRSRLPPENLDGYRLLLLGSERLIRLYDGGRIRCDSEAIFLPREHARERLIRWLKSNAKRLMTTLCARRGEETGASYRSVSITSAKTRWGSCSYNNALHFSFRLLYAPVEVADYVAVHELCHTFYKNHGKSFWELVERYVPDWREKRKWLKDHAFLMEIF